MRLVFLWPTRGKKVQRHRHQLTGGQLETCTLTLNNWCTIGATARGEGPFSLEVSIFLPSAFDYPRKGTRTGRVSLLWLHAQCAVCCKPASHIRVGCQSNDHLRLLHALQCITSALLVRYQCVTSALPSALLGFSSRNCKNESARNFWKVSQRRHCKLWAGCVICMFP